MRDLAALLLLATAAAAPAPVQPVVKPASVALAAQAGALLAGGQTGPAIERFETSLAVDPTNRAAYVGLARAARTQGLPGKAIKYYREALELDPNDLDALEGQGGVFAERGAAARAAANLARIKTLCGAAACPPARRLEIAIAAAAATPAPAPPRTALSTPPVAKP